MIMEDWKNKLKILIATGIYPPDLGGPATLLTRLPDALRAREAEVKVITYSDVVPEKGGETEKEVYRIGRRQCSFCRQAIIDF